nr:helix-turn-helix transcriptional regulator [Corynebacterium sp. p3-SID1056]
MTPALPCIATQVREQRRAMQLTQADVAELAMVSERFIREFEQGKPSVRLDKVEAVLAVLGLELAAVQHVPEALR